MTTSRKELLLEKLWAQPGPAPVRCSPLSLSGAWPPGLSQGVTNPVPQEPKEVEQGCAQAEKLLRGSIPFLPKACTHHIPPPTSWSPSPLRALQYLPFWIPAIPAHRHLTHEWAGLQGTPASPALQLPTAPAPLPSTSAILSDLQDPPVRHLDVAH